MGRAARLISKPHHCGLHSGCESRGPFPGLQLQAQRCFCKCGSRPRGARGPLICPHRGSPPVRSGVAGRRAGCCFSSAARPPPSPPGCWQLSGTSLKARRRGSVAAFLSASCCCRVYLRNVRRGPSLAGLRPELLSRAEVSNPGRSESRPPRAEHHVVPPGRGVRGAGAFPGLDGPLPLALGRFSQLKSRRAEPRGAVGARALLARPARCASVGRPPLRHPRRKPVHK